MKYLKAFFEDTLIADRVCIADSFISRLVGLLGRSSLEQNEGLLIKKCKQVHCIGMRFTIDVLFLSDSGEIISIKHNMSPGSLSKYFFQSSSVLELPSGAAEKFNIFVGGFIKFDKNYNS